MNSAKLKKIQQRNPLRRVWLECHGWVRDPQAEVSDWIWCDQCNDFSRVEKVVA